MKRINVSALERIAKKYPTIESPRDLNEYKAYYLKRIVDGTMEECIGVRTSICGKGLLEARVLIYVKREDGKYYFKEIL